MRLPSRYGKGFTCLKSNPESKHTVDSENNQKREHKYTTKENHQATKEEKNKRPKRKYKNQRENKVLTLQ